VTVDIDVAPADSDGDGILDDDEKDDGKERDTD